MCVFMGRGSDCVGCHFPVPMTARYPAPCSTWPRLRSQPRLSSFRFGACHLPSFRVRWLRTRCSRSQWLYHFTNPWSKLSFFVWWRVTGTRPRRLYSFLSAPAFAWCAICLPFCLCCWSSHLPQRLLLLVSERRFPRVPFLFPLSLLFPELYVFDFL